MSDGIEHAPADSADALLELASQNVREAKKAEAAAHEVTWRAERELRMLQRLAAKMHREREKAELGGE